MSTVLHDHMPEPLPANLLAGGRIAFVKRIPRGFDHGLDGYAIARFSAHFRRYGAAVEIVDEARGDAAHAMRALCRDPALLFVHSFNGAGGAFTDPEAPEQTLYDRFAVPFLARARNAFFAVNSRAAFLSRRDRTSGVGGKRGSVRVD